MTGQYSHKMGPGIPKDPMQTQKKRNNDNNDHNSDDNNSDDARESNHDDDMPDPNYIGGYQGFINSMPPPSM